jgi:hypothetical protein
VLRLLASRSLLRAGLLAAVVAFPACRRAASGPPPERFLDPGAGALVVIPELRRAERELAALAETSSAFPGVGQTVANLRSGLAAQLGFDLLDPEALARAGIEPARGAALGNEPVPGGAPNPVLILPVRDAAALEALVVRLAREREGAPDRSQSEQGAVRIVTFRTAAGAPPDLALGFLATDRVAAISPGPGGPAAVASALSRTAARSAAESPRWRELRDVLGGKYALILADPRLPPDVAPFGREGMALGVTGGAGVLRLGLAARLGAEAASLRALRAGGDSQAAVRSLSPSAPLVLRWDGDPAELGKRLVALAAPGDVGWLAAHGFDLQRDLFDQLAPGTAASLAISPRLDLAGVSDLELRADPLRLVRFELVGDVKDEASARRALARLPALAAALAGPVSGKKPAAVDPAATRIVTPSGEIAWRLDGKRLFVAGGPPGDLDGLLARQGASKGWDAPTPAAAAALKGGLGGAVLDPRSLAASVRALPEEAFGTGPGGFVVQSIVERLLETADRISAVSARAELTSTALLVEVQVDAPAAAHKGAAR